MAYKSMSYWDVYALPVPIRKWLIQRYNKHSDSTDPTPSSDRPMTEVERVKMISQAQQVNNNPLNNQQLAQKYLQPARNK